jgi:hypothetical protein
MKYYICRWCIAKKKTDKRVFALTALRLNRSFLSVLFECGFKRRRLYTVLVRSIMNYSSIIFPRFTIARYKNLRLISKFSSKKHFSPSF